MGLQIRNLRVKSGLEQGALASKINRDKQFLNRYEMEGANPGAFILDKLATALEVTWNDLRDFSQISEGEVELIYKKLQKKKI